LHVHLEELDYVDHASLELIMSWEVQHKATGGSLVIDWGTLGSMFRDRRRTPRKEAGGDSPSPPMEAAVDTAQSQSPPETILTETTAASE
jgi:hypothetical protein